MSVNRFPMVVVYAYDRWQDSGTADDFALFIRALDKNRVALGRGVRSGDVSQVLSERFPAAAGTQSFNDVLAESFPTRAGAGDDTPDSPAESGAPAVGDRHQPRVAEMLEAATGDPGNPDTLAAVGNAYFDWAAELEDAGLPNEATPLWLLAVEYYDKSLEFQPDNAHVLGDKAFALYWAESPLTAGALQDFIAKAERNRDLVQQVERAREMLSEVP